MATAYTTIGSKFQPYTLAEMLVPYQTYKQEFDKREELYNTYAENAGLIGSQLDDILDKDLMDTVYNPYMQELNQAAATLSSKGLSSENRKTLQNLRRRFGSDIAPIKVATEARAEARKNWDKLSSQDRTLMTNANPYYQAVSNYMNGKSPETYYVSGNELYGRGKALAEAFSRTLRDVPEGEALANTLGGQYYRITKQYGPDSKQMQDFMNDVVGSIPELRSQIEDILNNTDIGKQGFTKEDRNKAEQYIIEGMKAGLSGKTDVQYLENKNFIDPYQRWKMRGEDGNPPKQPYQYRTTKEVFNSEGYGRVIDDILATKSFDSPIRIDVGGKEIEVNSPMQATLLTRANQKQIKDTKDRIKERFGIDVDLLRGGQVMSVQGPNATYVKKGNNYVVYTKTPSGTLMENKDLTNTFSSEMQDYMRMIGIQDLYKETGISDKAISEKEEAKLREKYNIGEDVPISRFTDYMDTPEIHSWNRDIAYIALPGDLGKPYREAISSQISASLAGVNGGKKTTLGDLKINGGEGENLYILKPRSSARREKVGKLKDVFKFDDSGNITNISTVTAIPEVLARGGVTVETDNGTRIEIPLQYLGNMFDTLDTPKEGSSYTLRDIIKASLDRNQYDVADAAAMQFVNTSFPMTGDNFFQMQPGTLNVTKD